MSDEERCSECHAPEVYRGETGQMWTDPAVCRDCFGRLAHPADEHDGHWVDHGGEA